MEKSTPWTGLTLFSENLVFLILWVLVFSFPVMLSTGGDGIDWVRTLHELIKIFPFFLLFLLNNYLFTNLIIRKQMVHYLIVAIFAVLIFGIIASFNHVFAALLDIPWPVDRRPRVDKMYILNNMFYNSVFAILVIGLNNAVKFSFIWANDRRKYEQLQKENLKNQLSLLRNQLSPHFFMNTLNNIHALIDYNKEIAKDSVVKLSQLMRVLLYDADSEYFTLKKEIDFLKDYIALMQIRLRDDVEIHFDYPETSGIYRIPPLLFLNFVENAFKHGIKAKGGSFIHIRFEIQEPFLLVSIRNSKKQTDQTMPSGDKIGILNAKQRLDILYKDAYEIIVKETEDSFGLKIKLPIQ